MGGGGRESQEGRDGGVGVATWARTSKYKRGE
jgi:hypothetical protein